MKAILVNVMAGALVLASVLLATSVATAQVDDHLKCYKVKDPAKILASVDLNGPQFGLEPGCKVKKAAMFCVPVTKTVNTLFIDKVPTAPLSVFGTNPGDRICYKIKCPVPPPPPPDTLATDQFGSRTLSKFKAYMLCMPAVVGNDYCGDGVTNGNEACDAGDDTACPGACQANCTCLAATPAPCATSTPMPTSTPVPCGTSTPIETSTPVPCGTAMPIETSTPIPCGTATPISTSTPIPCATSTPPPRFVDNGDGTITDNQTGLQWEKKVAGTGCPHCVSDTYTWSSSGTPPDGTVFTSFLATVNGGVTGVGDCVASGGGNTITGGFNDHCDWRLPTTVELQTILLAPFPCLTSPCIDPIFGPTTASGYWTSNVFDASDSWLVFFNIGAVNYNPNGTSRYARAVRGGS